MDLLRKKKNKRKKEDTISPVSKRRKIVPSDSQPKITQFVSPLKASDNPAIPNIPVPLQVSTSVVVPYVNANLPSTNSLSPPSPKQHKIISTAYPAPPTLLQIHTSLQPTPLRKLLPKDPITRMLDNKISAIKSPTSTATPKNTPSPKQPLIRPVDMDIT